VTTITFELLCQKSEISHNHTHSTPNTFQWIFKKKPPLWI